ncbi:MAG: PEGA domain-containing protein, partial [Planctomycetes bacterium]|nr:PEGA domain-containing protein [Planctomycetota bacterium]
LGELQLSASVDDVHVFVDARFVGETGKAGTQLVVRLAGGTHEVRVTASGHADLVERVDIKPKKRIRVRAHLTPMAGETPPPPCPFAPRIGIGQTMRTKLFVPPGGQLVSASWQFAAEAGDRIILGAIKGAKGLSFELRSAKPGSSPIQMAMPEHLSGPLPTSRARETSLREAGIYRLTVTASVPGPATLVFGLYRSPPPIVDPADFPNAPPRRRYPSPKR